MAKAKNPYKKYIKAVLDHHDGYKLAIERTGDDYYICDGISLLKLPRAIYCEFFPGADHVFVHLLDGERIEYPSGSLTGQKMCKNELAALFTGIIEKEYVDVTKLIAEDISDYDHKVKRKIRIAIIGNEIAGFNEEYILSAKEFAGVFIGTKSTAPIKWSNHIMGMALMPIMANAFRRDIEKIQKAKKITSDWN